MRGSDNLSSYGDGGGTRGGSTIAAAKAKMDASMRSRRASPAKSPKRGDDKNGQGGRGSQATVHKVPEKEPCNRCIENTKRKRQNEL